MNKFLAILWSIALGVNLVSMLVGNEPTWLLVFYPLVVLVWESWEKYFRSRM